MVFPVMVLLTMVSSLFRFVLLLLQMFTQMWFLIFYFLFLIFFLAVRSQKSDRVIPIQAIHAVGQNVCIKTKQAPQNSSTTFFNPLYVFLLIYKYVPVSLILTLTLSFIQTAWSFCLFLKQIQSRAMEKLPMPHNEESLVC